MRTKARKLHIDIETFSATDINTGVYRYAEDPFFKIQIFGYTFDNDPVKVLDLEQGDKIPRKVVRAILDKNVEKWAHNAQFERVCLSLHILGSFGVFLDPEGWRDTAVYGATLGLPRSLDGMSRALGGSETKDAEGKALIRYFAIPCKPTKANGMRTCNLPEHAPDKWQKYLDYNGQDVVTERYIETELNRLYPAFPAHEWKFYEVDQRINDRGIPVDRPFVRKAIDLKERLRRRASRKLYHLTGVEKVTELAKIKAWAAKEGYPLKSLDANTKSDLLNDTSFKKEYPRVYKAVKFLDEAGGSAVAKYDAIINATNNDGRVRGQLIFYGAGATGRFAGRGVQVQNLPRVYLKADKLEDARQRLLDGKRVTIDELKQLVRTSFHAEPGTILAVSDYAQIEARVLPWYAAETWALEAFRAKQDIYVATAVRMYHVDYDEAKANYRQRGKQATLALGYGGGTGALLNMGALRDGIPATELPDLVTTWRQANPNVVKFWADVERAAKLVIISNGKKRVTLNGKLRFTYKAKDRLLQIWLPSGRALSYYDAHVKTKKNDYGFKPRKTIYYLKGVKNNGERYYTDTFGGKLVENIVQATARDILCEALLRIEDAGLETLFHVHDEVITEVPPGFDIDELSNLMTDPLPKWAEGLPLGSEGDTIQYYRKV